MKKIANFLGCLLLLVSAGKALGGESPTANDLHPAIGKFDTVATSPFYGTAIAFEEDATSVYLLTNAHIVYNDNPRWQEYLADLRLSLPQCQSEPLPFSVVGVSPGEDVAVVKVIKTAACTSLPASAEARFFADAELERFWLSDDDVAIGLLGYPRYQKDSTPSFQTELWFDSVRSQIEAYIKLRKLPFDFNASISRKPRYLIRREHDCPPYFLDECYLVPILSWGYSGGAFVVTFEGRNKILGIVSHFSPLSQDTYVIPMTTALQTGRRLMAKAAASGDGTPVMELEGLDGTFEYVSRSEVRVLKGPLAGKLVRSPKAAIGLTAGGHDSAGGGHDSAGGGHDSAGGGHDSAGGGHDSAGGGHDSAGGGHDSAGGGHDSAGGGADVRILRSSVTKRLDGGMESVFSMDRLLLELQKPQEWIREIENPMRRIFHTMTAFRGVEALLQFRPGVEIRSDDAAYRRYVAFANHPIESLRDFLTRYRTEQSANLSMTTKPLPLPPEFSFGEEEEINQGTKIPFGLYSRATVFERVKPKAVPGSKFTIKTESPDFTAVRSTVTVAQMIRKDGAFVIQAFVAETEPHLFFVEFPARFTSDTGQVYRYAGPMRVIWSKNYGQDPDYYPGYGVIVMQRGRDGLFELKMIHGSPRVKDKGRGSEYGRREMILQGFYMPLWEK